MIKRKCFVCGDFKHIVHNCRNIKSRREGKSIPVLLNKFEVLISRVMNVGISSGDEVRKDRKTILRERKRKKEKTSKSKEVLQNELLTYL